MTDSFSQTITSAEVVLPCDDLEETLAFFIDRLGFRVETIFPADSPRVAVISGHGLRLRLAVGAPGPVPRLRIVCDHASRLQTELQRAPNSLPIEFVATRAAIELPSLKPSHVVSRIEGADWVVGRAGMLYRDLIPDRQGGLFIASHIHIPEGGPVPDYPHFHKIRFQVIYCHRGWGRVVYEGQGAPFIMHPGDCVLQPPEIRHQVLECSSNLEVIEIGCPAIHETWADHDMTLPTRQVDSGRLFSDQRFVRHAAEQALLVALDR